MWRKPTKYNERYKNPLETSVKLDTRDIRPVAFHEDIDRRGHYLSLYETTTSPLSPHLLPASPLSLFTRTRDEIRSRTNERAYYLIVWARFNASLSATNRFIIVSRPYSDYCFLQGYPVDRSIRHHGVQHDNGRYVDLRYNIHGGAVRLLPVVLLFVQRIPGSEIIPLQFLSLDLDGIVSDNPWRLQRKPPFVPYKSSFYCRDFLFFLHACFFSFFFFFSAFRCMLFARLEGTNYRVRDYRHGDLAMYRMSIKYTRKINSLVERQKIIYDIPKCYSVNKLCFE